LLAFLFKTQNAVASFQTAQFFDDLSKFKKAIASSHSCCCVIIHFNLVSSTYFNLILGNGTIRPRHHHFQPGWASVSSRGGFLHWLIFLGIF
jgi:hypothetical protein